ncbi:MAG: GIDE domain-containing protein [Gammaproteobacteria bacterium]
MLLASFSSLATWAQNAPADDFWGWPVFLIIVSIGSFIGTFYCLIRKRVIQDTPTSKIRSASQGHIELTGHGELIDNQPITAPLTNTICTWYRYEIEEQRGSGKNSRWVTIEEETSDELFLLIDDTAQAVIDPEGANVTPTITYTWYGSSKFPSKGPAKRNSGFFSFGFGRYRYTEKRMHPGDPLYALGLFKTTGGAGSKFNINNDLRDLLAEWKKDSNILLEKFDGNKDGEIDMEEWQQVRETALKETLAKHEEYKTAPPVHMVGKTNDKRRPYLLSAIPQSSLIKKYSMYSSVLIIAFFLSGLLATFLINARLAG